MSNPANGRRAHATLRWAILACALGACATGPATASCASEAAAREAQGRAPDASRDGGAAAPAPAADAARTASMTPARTYVAPGAPVEVIIDAPAGAAASVLMLDAAGEVIGAARNLQAGRVDLRRQLGTLDTLPRAAWLQLAVDGTPLGAPIVVVPLHSAPPVRTRLAQRPDGSPYTRVIGWGDTLLDPADPEDIKAKEAAQWIAGDAPSMSGHRLYRDVDVVLETDQGTIRIALSPDAAPATAWNFISLARDGFYDGTTFHRVVPLDRQGRPFVIQGGDPTGTGDGGPGHALALEPSALPHDYGIVSMARADDPHSAGSQFFVALGREACARLDGQYCAFGYAVEGARAVDAIAASPIADPATGRPKRPPAIRRATLADAPARMPGTDRRASRIAPTATPAQPAPQVR
jgi:peptidyl-prolyl cis-trans isomerase B (cyclophilin B)